MPLMDPNRHGDSGEMYSPDEQGEYMLLDGTPRFSVQGSSDALADVGEGITKPPAEEYAMMLEVTMADHLGWPHPPTFSWNAGMVMHILKSDPVLRELECVQVDGLGTAYLFFYDRQGCCGLQFGLMWRRLFQNGSCIPLILPLASYPWWRPGGGLLPPLTVNG